MVRLQERIVFLGGSAGQRQEPVRIMARPFRQRPRLHRAGDVVGDIRVERRAVADRFQQFPVGLRRQEFFHGRKIEYVFTKKLIGPFRTDSVGDAHGGRLRHAANRLPSRLVAHKSEDSCLKH
ncbi:hypothetical protein SDC9_195578 [bioreactor metagenome]|uniref:Uncharacterized protein n=1 Tax=bioreactor metagenome TaxID=1076179 RepID=A0A645II39_9ZZZZ